MQQRIGWPLALAAAGITLVVGFAGGTLALGYGPWLSLGAGVVFGVSVFLVLRLVVRGGGAGERRNRRLVGLMVLAGGLMLVAGLLALRVPDGGRARLLAAIAFASAGVYFAAGLFHHLSARRGGSGP